MQQILKQHEKDLQDALSKHNANRDRQLEDLRRRLADKRRQREEQLRKKHAEEVCLMWTVLKKSSIDVV